MSTEIVVNSENLETRAAVLEDGKLVEVHYERNVSRRLAGNIYLGKVVRVLPGMQAAFVDIGLDKNAFLYIDDISESACDSGGIGESERCGSDRMRQVDFQARSQWTAAACAGCEGTYRHQGSSCYNQCHLARQIHSIDADCRPCRGIEKNRVRG